MVIDTRNSAVGGIAWQEAHNQACPQGQVCSAHGNPYVLIPDYDVVREHDAKLWDAAVGWAVARKDGDPYVNPYRNTA